MIKKFLNDIVKNLSMTHKHTMNDSVAANPGQGAEVLDVPAHKNMPSVTKPVNVSIDILTEKLLAHPVHGEMPYIKFGSTPAVSNANRVAVAERLLDAYHKAVADEVSAPIKREGEDMWTKIISEEMHGLMEALETRNAHKLADVLMAFGSSYVWFGGVTTCIDGYNRNLEPDQVALTYWDKLLRVAEYLGVRPVENPEYGSWGDAIKQNPQDVATAIEDAIGISICAPLGVIHTDGLQLNEGVLHYRHINALYSALRLSDLTKGMQQRAVCEYGGGIALTAYYARQFGIYDYTILDLPITCLLSGHYLLHACGEDAVSLYGEHEAENRIKVHPYWECMAVRDKKFLITLNQDGLNEIADNLREEYREQIKRTTRQYFLSINHEYFFPKTVASLMKNDPAYRTLYRSPYWVREGYVEELFEISATPEPT